VIALIVVGAASSGRIDPAAHGWAAPLAIFALALSGMNAGMLCCRLFGLPSRDRIAIGIEAGVRNTNLALLIKASVFPAVPGRPDPIGDGAFFVALLYGAFALPTVLPPLLLHRRRARL
jgi:BASS family bile acid:Na+ symporter